MLQVQVLCQGYICIMNPNHYIFIWVVKDSKGECRYDGMYSTFALDRRKRVARTETGLEKSFDSVTE